jgi:hypothetical protein
LDRLEASDVAVRRHASPGQRQIRTSRTRL